jgi:hypothetical protein
MNMHQPEPRKHTRLACEHDYQEQLMLSVFLAAQHLTLMGISPVELYTMDEVLVAQQVLATMQSPHLCVVRST